MLPEVLVRTASCSQSVPKSDDEGNCAVSFCFLPMKFISWRLFVCLSAICWAFLGFDNRPANSAEPWQGVFQRRTDDVDHDLISKLIQQQRFDEATLICQWGAKHASKDQDDLAKWSIRFSQVRTAKIASGQRFTATDLEVAKEPVSRLLKSYPDHARALFLQSQVLEVDREAAVAMVVARSVSTKTESEVEAAFTKLARVTRSFEEHAKRVREKRDEVKSRNNSYADNALGQDLVRMEHELHAAIVSMALMQTNLFPDGSRDQVSAANRAEQAAMDALSVLPNESIVRTEVDRMRVESIVRAGEFSRARPELQRLMRQVGQPTPPRLMALLIQLELGQQNNLQASRYLTQYYGDNPADAQPSIEMDLVRLEYLVSTKDASVGAWLDAIEKRSGLYARRRAESLSLSRARTASDDQAVDPSIIAAQGQEWLRKGDHQRAAELLKLAARAEVDPNRSITRAIESASAYLKSNDRLAAANVLTETALENPSAEKAADVHLQAAVVVSSAKQRDTLKRVETALLGTIEKWPKSSAAVGAQKWLVRLLDQQERFHEKAIATTKFLEHHPSATFVTEALDAWLEWLPNTEPSKQSDLIQDFIRSFDPIQSEATVAKLYPSAAVFLLDADQLDSLPSEITEDAFASEFLRFRRNHLSEELTTKPAENRVALARWRLTRDGESNPSAANRIAKQMQGWPPGTSIQRATEMVWLGKSQEAVDLVAEEVKSSAKPTHLWKSLVRVLANSNNISNKKIAVEVWDRLATGLPKGSDTWHQAKISAIELMIEMGQTQQAAKRSKYVLLTNAPADESLRLRYQRAAKN